MYKRVAVILFLVILVLPLVMSQSFVQTTDTTLDLSYPKYQYVALNQDFDLHLHVINSTSIMKNTSTTCFIHLYNITGGHICENWLDFDTNKLEWELTIDKGNFTTRGVHAYILLCNSTSNEVGFASGNFIVNTNGVAPPENNVFVFFALGFIIVVASMTGLFLYTLGLFVEEDFTMKHLIYNLSAYFAIFAFYILEQEYFRYSLINTILLVFLSVGGITNVIFPIVVFFISLTLWKWRDLEKW